MLYSEIIAVCSQIHTKHINQLCGQNVVLLNVKPAVGYIQKPLVLKLILELNVVLAAGKNKRRTKDSSFTVLRSLSEAT
jgi:hypothetical protein